MPIFRKASICSNKIVSFKENFSPYSTANFPPCQCRKCFKIIHSESSSSTAISLPLQKQRLLGKVGNTRRYVKYIFIALLFLRVHTYVCGYSTFYGPHKRGAEHVTRSHLDSILHLRFLSFCNLSHRAMNKCFFFAKEGERGS